VEHGQKNKIPKYMLANVPNEDSETKGVYDVRGIYCHAKYGQKYKRYDLPNRGSAAVAFSKAWESLDASGKPLRRLHCSVFGYNDAIAREHNDLS